MYLLIHVRKLALHPALPYPYTKIFLSAETREPHHAGLYLNIHNLRYSAYNVPLPVNVSPVQARFLAPRPPPPRLLELEQALLAKAWAPGQPDDKLFRLCRDAIVDVDVPCPAPRQHDPSAR